MEQTQTDRTLNRIPSRAEDVAYDARAKLNEAVTTVQQKARDAVQYTRQQVQANPWTAVGVGFGFGVALGALLGALIASQQRGYINRIV